MAFYSCKKHGSYPLNPLYDLDFSLQGDAGTGLIKFRQNPDTVRSAVDGESIEIIKAGLVRVSN